MIIIIIIIIIISFRLRNSVLEIQLIFLCVLEKFNQYMNLFEFFLN